MTAFPRKAPLVALAVWVACAGPPLFGQAETTGRVSGEVRGADGSPIEGARVWIRLSGPLEGRALEIRTDAKGRWSQGGLQAGRWDLRVRAEGHVDGVGWFEVLPQRSATRIDMELRSLDEESAAFAEGGSGTLGTWLERANSFLAHGRASEARDEYRKVLTLVSVDERPQILRAVARSWYLEGEMLNALDALEEALRIAPHDPETRLLYRGLMEQVGRAEQVDPRLAELEAAGPPPPPPPSPQRQYPPSPGPPPDAPEPHRTGQQRLFFSETNPLGEALAYAERFGLTGQLKDRPEETPGPRSLEAETFQVYVPESYRPEFPHGLLVWVSPTPFGGFRSPDYPRVLADQRLIWVGADRSGNTRASWDRTALALDAVHNAKSLYAIDPERIYVAGYSGGGRLSSSLVLLYPDVFTGGIFFYGCNWFERLPVPDKPGSLWPEKFRRPPDLARLKADSRLVFVTGELDFNRQQTRATYERAVELGFEHATYLEIPSANHYYGIPAEWLEKSLEALLGD